MEQRLNRNPVLWLEDRRFLRESSLSVGGIDTCEGAALPSPPTHPPPAPSLVFIRSTPSCAWGRRVAAEAALSLPLLVLRSSNALVFMAFAAPGADGQREGELR